MPTDSSESASLSILPLNMSVIFSLLCGPAARRRPMTTVRRGWRTKTERHSQKECFGLRCGGAVNVLIELILHLRVDERSRLREKADGSRRFKLVPNTQTNSYVTLSKACPALQSVGSECTRAENAFENVRVTHLAYMAPRRAMLTVSERSASTTHTGPRLFGPALVPVPLTPVPDELYRGKRSRAVHLFGAARRQHSQTT